MQVGKIDITNGCVVCGVGLASSRAKLCGNARCNTRVKLLREALAKAPPGIAATVAKLLKEGYEGHSNVENALDKLRAWLREVNDAVRDKSCGKLRVAHDSCDDCEKKRAVWYCDDEMRRCTPCARKKGYATEPRKCRVCGVAETVSALGFSNIAPLLGCCTDCVNRAMATGKN